MSFMLLLLQIYFVSVLIYGVCFLLLILIIPIKLSRLGVDEHMTIQSIINSKEDKSPASIWWYLSYTLMPGVRLFMLVTLVIFAVNTSYFIDWMKRRTEELEDREL